MDYCVVLHFQMRDLKERKYSIHWVVLVAKQPINNRYYTLNIHSFEFRLQNDSFVECKSFGYLEKSRQKLLSECVKCANCEWCEWKRARKNKTVRMHKKTKEMKKQSEHYVLAVLEAVCVQEVQLRPNN